MTSTAQKIDVKSSGKTDVVSLLQELSKRLKEPIPLKDTEIGPDDCASCSKPLENTLMHSRLGDDAFCMKCFNDETKVLQCRNRHCDFERWRMFAGTAHLCQPLDYRKPWWVDVSANEDLCLYHGERLMASTDEKQAQYQQSFKKFATADVFQSYDMNQLVHFDDDRRDACFPAPITVSESLTLPDGLTDAEVIPHVKKFYGLEDADEKETETELQWSDTVRVNGQELVTKTTAGTILERPLDWVPFETQTFPDEHSVASCVNCNPNSPWFHQVATACLDDHFRMSVDLAQCDFKTFQAEKSQVIPAKEIEYHPRVRCNGCGIQPMFGPGYHCKQCPDFDFCCECYEGKKAPLPDYQADKHDPNTHEMERRVSEERISDYGPIKRSRLRQSFYFG